MHACMISRSSLVRLFATLWTAAHQAPLSMGFSRQEYWSGLPCPSPGDLPNSGIEPESLMSHALAGGFFTTSTTWEVQWVPYRREISTQTRTREECYGKMRARLPQAWEPPDAGGEAGTHPSEAPSEGVQPCQHADLRLLASRPCDNTFLWFKPFSGWYFVMGALAH